MWEDEELLDPTIPFMTLDIARKILAMVDNLPALANYLAETIRELTGAKLVVLVQCADQPFDQPHCVLSVNPLRRHAEVSAQEFSSLFEVAHGLDEVTVWSQSETDEPAVLLLHQLGYRSPCIGIPLRTGEHRVGVIMALGLPVDAAIPNLKEALTHLADIVALVLHNSNLVYEQDALIRRRTTELEESEARFRRFLDNVPDVAVQGLLPDGTINYWNHSNERLYGYGADEALGKNLFDLIVRPQDRPLMEKEFGRAALTGETPSHGERLMQTKACTEVPVYSSCVLIERPGKEPELFRVDIDLTDQKRMETRLRHSERMDAVGQLAGGVAHDFNNQLTPIVGFAELLSRRLEDDRLKVYADMIFDAAKRSSDLVRQLLAFSRKGNFVCVPVDLHSTIEQSIRLLQHSIDKQIEIRHHFASKRATVEGDPSQLESMLINLGVNARDAMPDGGELCYETTPVTLDEASCAEIGEDILPGSFMQLIVSDTGIGMDKATQEHIFDPFFTTKGQGGTGLGLAAVYGTVKSMNGAIQVHSRPGEGTCFRIFLPAADIATEDLDRHPELIEIPEVHVLVVDDEAAVRSTSGAVLNVLGHKVTCCESGNEAVNVYLEHWKHIDVVILDMMMPGMDGHETYSRLKQINPNVRVLFTSGNLETEFRSKSGAVRSFIQKPFLVNELAQKLTEVLS